MADQQTDAQLRAWIYKVAYDRTRSQPWNIEDAAQEGMIAAWEAWQHRPGDTGYAHGAAKNAIIGFSTGHKKPYGHVGHRGWQEASLIPVDPVYLPEKPACDHPSDLAYHRREIAVVVSELTFRQREIVHCVAFGLPRTASQGGEWYGRLRPRLAERLDHLRSAV